MSKVLLVALLALAACTKPPKKEEAHKGSASGSGVKVTRPLFGDDKPPDAMPADATGEQIYGKLCATCHGANGEGGSADYAPSLRNQTFLATASDNYLLASIRDGRTGSSMGAYGKARGGPLDDAATDKIIAYLREGGPAPVALEAKPSKGDAKKGQAVWDKTCKACHGDPTTRAIAPQLSSTSFLAVASDEFLRYAIEQGRPGTKMLPMGGAKLTPEEIEDVIALIRSWQSTDPVKPVEEVHAPHPKDTQIVLNPKGKTPKFTVKEERFVSAAEVNDALQAKQRLVIIDARPPSEWAAMHITGAISVPYYEPELLDEFPEELKKDTWVFAYCACPHHLSGVVVDELQKRGFAHAMVIDEGINFWHTAGYPIEGNAPPPVQKPAEKPAEQPAEKVKVKTP